jgi:nucleotide-binding universal stress UspA family protein
MLVMATKAVDNPMRRLFGTISSEVSRQSKKPVLVVPPQATIKFPGKIVVGFTEELMLEDTLEYILAFGAKNSVFFDFVHITGDMDQFTALKNKLYERLVINREMLCGFNIRSVTDHENKIHEVLFDYALEVRAGMVILVTHHRSFLESLSHSSVTKKALQHPPLPLMIIHQSTGEEKD